MARRPFVDRFAGFKRAGAAGPREHGAVGAASHEVFGGNRAKVPAGGRIRGPGEEANPDGDGWIDLLEGGLEIHCRTALGGRKRSESNLRAGVCYLAWRISVRPAGAGRGT